MSIWEISLILGLCIIFLSPSEIKELIKNITNLVLNINRYINSTKEHIIKSIDLDKK